jgi:hypothetical protein
MRNAGAGAIRSWGIQSNQPTATAPAPALSISALTGNTTIGAMANSTNPATMTAPTNWTERHDVGNTNPTMGLEVATLNSGFTGTTVTWGSNSGSVFASIIIEVDDNIDGTLTKTLGDLTLSSAGTTPIVGGLSTTLGAATLTSAGTTPIDGDLSTTLGAATLSSEGTVVDANITGDMSVTLGDATLSATGTTPIVGGMSASLGDATLSSEGAIPAFAAATLSLSDATLSSTGTTPIVGGMSTTLGEASLFSAGDAPIFGELSVTLGAATLSSENSSSEEPAPADTGGRRRRIRRRAA